ncbi:MAG: helix-turn-helix domain-containing protein [Hydrogenophaga sp.]|uniref:helix-turn-helix domain-containing protein n=1 Tax=Hydrogenophaga sp. TaxID=1904254 RepID=UPI0027171018|nr:helix-turn-helix domain-containing protein [Hydrogenophaga sp.]MDO9569319.1 helix-turn-helix domain-containing protein [Hydrogenophaga sp.]MDP3375303.1 helix-turn-helix domain-containing protein [Hydrogenophaga sp.]
MNVAEGSSMLVNSINNLSARYKADAKDKTAGKADPYATAAQSAAVLRSGAEFRKNRIAAADMLTTEEAAELAGVSRVTINAWIKQNRCIGIANLRRGFKLPKWQFEPQVFELIQPLFEALGTTDSWSVLAFLENSQDALDRRTPLVALEQGESTERILQLAMAEGH